MNRSVFESSPVQQMIMAAGNPNWWNINSTRPPISQPSSFPFLPPNNNSPNFFFPQFAPTSSSSSNSSSSLPMPSWQDHNQDYTHESLSQLLLNGLVGEEDKTDVMSQFQVKKLENNWEEQIMLTAQAPNVSAHVDIKQEVESANSYIYGHGFHDQDHQFQPTKPPPVWSQLMATNSTSSPNNSCVTNVLDFSNKIEVKHPPPDRSSEGNSSTAIGGTLKKARVQPSSSQTTFKVRKEKLGDRITTLHQLVSPFGKTDTASVLLEAIGYIRFLQSQIEALSLPYLGSGTGNMRQQQQSVHGDRNCMFPEHPGQLLNENCLKRKGASEQEEAKDLRSRGLCLVPVSCTLPVGSDNGADYWAPASGCGFR